LSTAIDTSVLLAIAGREPGYQAWEETLHEAAEEGGLWVCPVVFAELSPGAPSVSQLQAQLAKLAIGYDEITPEAAHHAGTIFWKYRREGGPRKHLLPDFLVAAHAQVQCGQLAATDRGYFRRYFPRLRLLKPKARGC